MEPLLYKPLLYKEDNGWTCTCGFYASGYTDATTHAKRDHGCSSTFLAVCSEEGHIFDLRGMDGDDLLFVFRVMFPRRLRRDELPISMLVRGLGPMEPLLKENLWWARLWPRDLLGVALYFVSFVVTLLLAVWAFRSGYISINPAVIEFFDAIRGGK